MKITCLKNKLKKALFFAERISGRSLQMPILQGVRLKTDKNILKITSTNLETGFEAKVPAQIEEDGEVVVPVRVLSQLVGGSVDEKIKMESINGNLNVSTEKISSLIKGYPIDEFPRLPRAKYQNTFSISASELSNGLKSVYNTASTSNVKLEIAGVFFNTQNKTPLKLVATDSFRLAEKTFDLILKDIDQFLLPIKSVTEVIRLLEDCNSNVEVSLDKNQVMFSFDNFQFISRLIEGVFPSYESIIPQKYAIDIIIDRDEMINALRSAGIFSGNLNEVILNIVSSDNLLEIRTKYTEVGEHTSQIPIQIKGGDAKFNFNYNYLLAGLQNINNSKVLLRFGGENKPLLIQEHGNSSYIYLIMPMNS